MRPAIPLAGEMKPVGAFDVSLELLGFGPDATSHGSLVAKLPSKQSMTCMLVVRTVTSVPYACRLLQLALPMSLTQALVKDCCSLHLQCSAG
jgi:hypothetical protein